MNTAFCSSQTAALITSPSAESPVKLGFTQPDEIVESSQPPPTTQPCKKLMLGRTNRLPRSSSKPMPSKTTNQNIHQRKDHDIPKTAKVVEFTPLATSSPTEMTKILEEGIQGRNMGPCKRPPPGFPKTPEVIITSNMRLDDEDDLPSDTEWEKYKESFNKVSPELNFRLINVGGIKKNVYFYFNPALYYKFFFSIFHFCRKSEEEYPSLVMS